MAERHQSRQRLANEWRRVYSPAIEWKRTFRRVYEDLALCYRNVRPAPQRTFSPRSVEEIPRREHVFPWDVGPTPQMLIGQGPGK